MKASPAVVTRRNPLGEWRSRTTFVLALSASAVGLGNLWRLSYLTGEYGGAPFLVAYVLCLFLVGVPVMVAEVVVGSHGRAGPLSALRHAADRSLRSRGWVLLGVLACLAGLLLLTCYTVVAGWALAYARFMQTGVFAAASVPVAGEQFEQFLGDPLQQAYWQTLFLLACLAVVVTGVRRGLGLLAWLAVPVLLALLGVLVRFSLDNGDLAAAQDFLFSVQWVDFTPQVVLVALGHAFFSLGIGVGVGISYGGYAPRRIPIGRSVVAVAVFDTVFALLAGVAVFPVVFANNLQPAMGPGLMFVSLPYAFGNLLQGELYGALFFALVVVAAMGSAVAVMEPVVTSLMQQFRIRRFTAVVLVGAALWLSGLAVVFSLDPAQRPSWLGGASLLHLLDTLTSAALLPLVVLCTAVFVGWRMRPELQVVVLSRESTLFLSLWRFVLRYIVPPATVLVTLLALLSPAA
ncbi:MAG: sodium-dependent transporter [Halioglobus sp.]|nr:sodium-dependent transporter [Halioglobus sp.]